MKKLQDMIPKKKLKVTCLCPEPKEKCEHGIIKNYCVVKACPNFGVQFAPSTTTKGWDEEFDERFGRAGFRANNVDWKVCAPEIKSFIAEQIEKAVKECALDHTREEWIEYKINNAVKAEQARILEKIKNTKEMYEPAYEEEDQAIVSILSDLENFITSPNQTK